MRFVFGRFELDASDGALRTSDQAVPIQPRVLQTLRYLVEHAGRTVSVDELHRALRDGGMHDSGSIPWNICQVRKSIGQTGTKSPIETVRGSGYRFVEPVRALEASPAQRQHPASPFFGRQGVMAELSAALDSARAGHGRLILVTGPPGIGKTRVATELTNSATAQGIGVLAGRCFGDPIAPAFWPFIQMLRASRDATQVPDGLRKDAEAYLDRIAPSEVAAPAPGFAERLDDGGFWLLDSMRQWLLRFARHGTHLLIIDDLQWADERSVQLLALLGEELQQARLLVVATLRTGVDELALGHALGLRGCTRIPLGGLSEHDVRCYLESALGADTAAALSRSVQECTGGNPLLVSEALSLIGYDDRTEDDAPLADAAALSKRLLRARAARLGDREFAALQAASVLGVEFMLPDLVRLSELQEDELLAWVDQALEQRLIVQQPSPETFMFAHDLLRETIYESLTVRQRALLHARAAEGLEGRVPVATRLNELAYHFYYALPYADRGRTTRYCCLAGEAALHVYAYEDAARYYDWAIRAQGALPEADAKVMCDLLIRSAAALMKVGRATESRGRCRQAIDLAKQVGEVGPLVAAAQLLRPSLLIAQQPDELLENAIQTALDMLQSGPSAERVLLYCGLAGVPPHSLSVDRSRDLADEALVLAKQLNNPCLVVQALRARLHALSGPDHIQALLGVTEEILDLDPLPASWSKAQAYLSRYQALTLGGDMVAADEALEAFGNVARQLRLAGAIWEFDRLHAQRLLQTGDVAAAEARFERLRQEGMRLGVAWAPAAYLIHRKTTQMHRTDHWMADELPDDWAARSWRHSLVAYRTFCIQLSIYRGCRDQARRELRSVLRGPIPKDSYYTATLVQLLLAAVQLEDIDVARDLHAQLHPYRALNPITVLQFGLGSTAYYLGLTSSLAGQHAQAQEEFEEATRTNRRLGYVPLALRSQLALSRTLLVTGGSGTRARARHLAQEVRQTARDLGMEALAKRAAHLAAQ